MRRVEVAPEIKALIPAQALADFCDEIAETELTCVVCGVELPAGSRTPVALQLLIDPADDSVTRVVPSHLGCSRSGVREVPGLATHDRDNDYTDGLDVRWYPMALPSGHLAIAWETSRRVLAYDDPAETADANVGTYLGEGFQLVGPSTIEADALPGLPLLHDWVARFSADGNFAILAPDGRQALAATLGGDAADFVSQLLSDAEWVVALTGSGLHADSENREAGLVYAAMRGQLVGARIPVEVGSFAPT
jgi:hypothetical protein